MVAAQKMATPAPPPVSQPLSDRVAAAPSAAADRLTTSSETLGVSPSRGGNAMGRARHEILESAAALIADSGLQAVTMSSVARRAGVAKATVYNHVRDRRDLLTAVLANQWTMLQKECADQPRDQRLSSAAKSISESALLAGLRRHDPDVIVAVSGAALNDQRVLDVVATWIPEGRDPEAALRWLVSFAVSPAQL